ncbi:hypothetical protein KR222_006626, partial [Zaprionus bogoriensis]
ASAANATLYYSAVEDMFKDLVLEQQEQQEESMKQHQQQQQVLEPEPWIATPKRVVRIRKHNLFGKDAAPEFTIHRRALGNCAGASPRSRRQRCEAE